MRAILINPWFKSITEVDIGGDNDIEKLLNNPLGPKVYVFTCGMMWPNGDTLYIDDEGLLKPGGRAFTIHTDDGIKALVGNALILGSDEEGNSVDVKATLTEIQTLVDWPYMVTT